MIKNLLNKVKIIASKTYCLKKINTSLILINFKTLIFILNSTNNVFF